MLDYFSRNGGRPCADDENPAEYMLEIVNAGKNNNGQDWFDVWKSSPEAKNVQRQIDQLHEEKKHEKLDIASDGGEFAMPLSTQIVENTMRAFQQYWRLPSYVLAKMALCTVASLFIGFSFFHGNSSIAGMETIIFSVFMLTTIFQSLVQQIHPLFVSQRALYESRERPSKAYSWIAFMFANIVVEIPYSIFAGILTFACFYYPVVGASQESSRQGLVLLFCIQLMLYTASFATMTIATLPNAETAAGLVSFLTLMSILFNGVLQSASQLPGFWLFMYRASPFTYWVGGMVATMVSGRQVICAEREVSIFDPPSGQTCGKYLESYASQAGGQVQNPNATSGCEYCALSNSDQFLAGSSIYYGDRWRNFGLMFAYLIFNIAIAIFSYYLFRVAKLSGFKRKGGKSKRGTKAQEGAEKVAEGVAGAAARDGGYTEDRRAAKEAETV